MQRKTYKGGLVWLSSQFSGPFTENDSGEGIQRDRRPLSQATPTTPPNSGSKLHTLDATRWDTFPSLAKSSRFCQAPPGIKQVTNEKWSGRIPTHGTGKT